MFRKIMVLGITIIGFVSSPKIFATGNGGMEMKEEGRSQVEVNYTQENFIPSMQVGHPEGTLSGNDEEVARTLNCYWICRPWGCYRRCWSTHYTEGEIPNEGTLSE